MNHGMTKDGMKPAILTLITTAIALCFVACGGTSSAPPPKAQDEWIWANGSNIVNQMGIYGTEATASSSNGPGARQSAVTWTDKSGNLWFFGGYGYDSKGNVNFLNDLWEYSGGQWIWMSGLNIGGQAGAYGTQGTAAVTNVPGARWGGVSWLDAAGNLWLFGGYGYASVSGTAGILNDLWEYTPAPPGQQLIVGEWTWMGGPNLTGSPGTYGTLGTPAATNIPGGRYGAVSWTDGAGNFWLFGGNGAASPGDSGSLNDLWKYSAGEWTWMGGSNLANQPGTYGTLGMAAPGNIPGGRFSAASWIDSSGNFWLFGGSGYDSSGTNGDLSDLWEYSARQWAWVNGSKVIGQAGVYGTQGTAAASNIPGARNGGFSWVDGSGNLWLFGGVGYDSTGKNSGWLNDLWEYSSGQWTWVDGSKVNGQIGTYGNPGQAASGNVPGARTLGATWTDASGNFWLFGGIGYDSLGENGSLNDFWEYKP
jgi:N-acetylneuraminic acid mutarotase